MKKILGLTVIIATLSSATIFASGIQETINVVKNSITIKVEGELVTADNILYDGTTYVPLRSISEMLGKEVGWDENTRTASIEEKREVKEEVTKSYSRRNPAPIGVKQSVTVESIREKYDAHVTTLDIIRGDKANKIVADANIFNNEPEDNEEYLLVKVKIKVNNVKDDKKVSVNSYDFKAFTTDNVKIDFKSPVLSDKLSSELYEDGETEGYIAYLVDKNDKNPKMQYGGNYDGTGGIWFSLHK